MSKQKPDITGGRQRTNILNKYEHRTIEYLCSTMPSWITSDILTFIGFMGAIVAGFGLYFASFDKVWLFAGIVGFAIHWFGDSLDGRLAYWRKIPRKWYGWALDITVDWLSLCIIGFGFYCFIEPYNFIAFIFVCAYGWAIINALVKYKITDIYSIDTHLCGGTEVRITISAFMCIEYFSSGMFLVFAVCGALILIWFNIADCINLLKAADFRDSNEKAGTSSESKKSS